MKALIIYDNNKNVVNIIYGMSEVPEGIQGFIITLQTGETVIGSTVDLTDVDNPTVETVGGVDLEGIYKKLEEQQNQIDALTATITSMTN